MKQNDWNLRYDLSDGSDRDLMEKPKDGHHQLRMTIWVKFDPYYTTRLMGCESQDHLAKQSQRGVTQLKLLQGWVVDEIYSQANLRGLVSHCDLNYIVTHLEMVEEDDQMM